MGKFINLAGQKFNSLTVLRIVDKRSPAGAFFWECLCDCGNIHITSGNSLKSGGCKSCGCRSKTEQVKRLKSESCAKTRSKGRTDKEILLQKFYKRYLKSTAERNKNISFLLSLGEFEKLVSSNCHYCGQEPSLVVKLERQFNPIQITFNGIDRKDSNGDYTVENSLPCCEFCNIAKNDMTYDEFLLWVKKVVNHNDL